MEFSCGCKRKYVSYQSEPGHQFSDRKPVWGWREDQPGVMRGQIDFAANSGLSFWGFCWYENTLVGDAKALDNLNNALDCFMAAPNKNRLEFCLLSCFPVSPVNWGKVCDRTIAYFKASNYLRVEGKPVMMFFNSDEVIAGLGGIKETRLALNQYRKQARATGAGELLLGARTRPRASDPAFQNKYAQCGFDFLIAYHNADDGRVKAGANDYADLLVGDLKAWNDISANTSLPFVPTVGTGYDMRPWAMDHPKTPASDYWYTGVTPESIGVHLCEGIRWSKAHKDKVLGNLLLMYAWNENGEGAWLTPTKSEGSARLEAVKNALHCEPSKSNALPSQ